MDNEIKIIRSDFESEVGRKLQDDEWERIVEAISDTVIELAYDVKDLT